jgi:hypothetical protein
MPSSPPQAVCAARHCLLPGQPAAPAGARGDAGGEAPGWRNLQSCRGRCVPSAAAPAGATGRRCPRRGGPRATPAPTTLPPPPRPSSGHRRGPVCDRPGLALPLPCERLPRPPAASPAPPFAARPLSHPPLSHASYRRRRLNLTPPPRPGHLHVCAARLLHAGGHRQDAGAGLPLLRGRAALRLGARGAAGASATAGAPLCRGAPSRAPSARVCRSRRRPPLPSPGSSAPLPPPRPCPPPPGAAPAAGLLGAPRLCAVAAAAAGRGARPGGGGDADARRGDLRDDRPDHGRCARGGGGPGGCRGPRQAPRARCARQPPLRPALA